ncbi:hypothetical protein CYMTET_25292, partial [Cymbomonas tetramitiformis]
VRVARPQNFGCKLQRRIEAVTDQHSFEGAARVEPGSSSSAPLNGSAAWEDCGFVTKFNTCNPRTLIFSRALAPLPCGALTAGSAFLELVDGSQVVQQKCQDAGPAVRAMLPNAAIGGNRSITSFFQACGTATNQASFTNRHASGEQRAGQVKTTVKKRGSISSFFKPSQMTSQDQDSFNGTDHESVEVSAIKRSRVGL